MEIYLYIYHIVDYFHHYLQLLIWHAFHRKLVFLLAFLIFVCAYILYVDRRTLVVFCLNFFELLTCSLHVLLIIFYLYEQLIFFVYGFLKELSLYLFLIIFV